MWCERKTIKSAKKLVDALVKSGWIFPCGHRDDGIEIFIIKGNEKTINKRHKKRIE